jgi:hypothetical protein
LGGLLTGATEYANEGGAGVRQGQGGHDGRTEDDAAWCRGWAHTGGGEGGSGGLMVPTAFAAKSGVNMPCAYVLTMSSMLPCSYSASVDSGVYGRHT